ncbi:MAG: hypothetical protein ABL913_13600 [Methyloglobulus sp.]
MSAACSDSRAWQSLRLMVRMVFRNGKSSDAYIGLTIAYESN